MQLPNDKRVLHALETRLLSIRIPADVKIFVIFGHPYSDIGKGTLVAEMLRFIPGSKALKIDGMLNSNLDGRYTARDHDDFGVYTKINPKMAVGPANHLLGGQLLTDFIAEYGGTNEVLSFKPYLATFAAAVLLERWRDLGKPKYLIVEMGGTPDDMEVLTCMLPAIQRLRMLYPEQLSILLLTVLAHNGQFIKSRPATKAVQVMQDYGLSPDIVVCREPESIRDISQSARLDIERRIRHKFLEQTGRHSSNVLTVPFYTPDQMSQYGSYLTHNLKPMLLSDARYSHVLIGTDNPYKLADWQSTLGKRVRLITPAELDLELTINEDLYSLKDNAMAKARSYSRLTGLPAVADDVGFFIDALDGEPGVATRRWGGQLPDETTDEQFYDYMKKRLEGTHNPTAYFERHVAAVLPNGQEFHYSYQTPGFIDTELLGRGFVPGSFPLGQVFKTSTTSKTWSNMTAAQKSSDRKAITDALVVFLSPHLKQDRTRTK